MTREKSSTLRSRGEGATDENRGGLPATAHTNEAEIGAREAAFRSFADDTPVPMALLDRDATVRYANAATANLLGSPVDALAGKSFFQQVHDEELKDARAFFQKTLRSPGSPVAGEFRFRLPGNGWRSVGVTALNRLDLPGLSGVVLNCHDVSDRRQSDETQARLAAIVESSHDAIIGETLEGVITTWNLAAERLYGYAAEEMIGKPISVTVPADRMGELSEYMSRVRRGERVDHLETVRLRKDGTRLDVSITVSPIHDDRGAIVGISKSSRDITERRRFEAEMWRKNIELEIANRAKNTFLASMSHELRTPLNSIIGFTGTLLMKLPGQLTKDQERQLHLIQFSARHLLSLINDLLDLAKVESGKTDIQLEPVACIAAAREVAGTLRPAAEAKGLTFEVSAPGAEITIDTDRRSLAQILINLTTNAIKFTEKGGVSIQVERRPATDGGRPAAQFRVVDTGLGIRAEDQRRLFRPFEQFHTAHAQEDPGSGLGLHLSQRMANLLGGKIEVTSEPGKGSAFTLSLPDR